MKWKIGFAAVVFVMTFMYAGKSALACKGSEVLYEDNFAALDPAWGDPGDKVSVNGNKMVIQSAVNSGWSVLNQGNVFEDMDACATLNLAKSDEPSGASAGILFWAKDYNEYYYVYLINGSFSVARWVGGRWLYPVSLRENPAIKKNLGEANQLRVVTKGTQATVFVNDTEIISFKGQPPQGGGLIGLRGESPANSQAVWEFSDLKITKP